MSARREAQLALLAQQASQAGTGQPTCPPDLRTPCRVWDWLTDVERPSVEASGHNAPAVVSAWRRWRTARRAYAARVGKPEMDACGPVSGPSLT